jgi:hypothetical protein
MAAINRELTMDGKNSLRASFTRLTLAAVTLGAAACGGGNGRSVPFDDLVGELLNAECDFLVACGAAPDRTTCLASIGPDSQQLDTFKVDIAAGIVLYDARAAGACIDAFKSLASCKQTAIGDFSQRINATCGKVFTGSLPAGSTCFFSEECANQGICSGQTCGADGCCTGTCVARPAPIPPGGDCTSLLQNQDCIDGTRCTANAAGGGTCKVPLAAGARCGPYDRCAPPYQCGGVVDPVTNEGTCTAPPGHGQACDMSGNCDDARDVCDQTTRLCTSRIAVGGACSTSGSCVAYANCDGTTCVAMPGPGASCDPIAQEPCLLSLSCDATTMSCSLPAPSSSCR